MSSEIKERVNKAIEEFHAAILECSASDMTSVTLIINCEGIKTITKRRSKDSLDKEGVSMRNLRGDFIS